MSGPDLRVDWRATEAADRLMLRSLELRADAQKALEEGYGDWFYEYTGLAVIAERASEAERTNPPDRMLPCGICRGRLACDLDYHRGLGPR